MNKEQYTKIDLSNLTQMYRQKQDMIDGSNLTNSPDKKFVKKRIISQGKRTAKIQELLNYCRYKTGELPSCEKPPMTIIRILTLVKHGLYDEIPKGYREAYECHKELITKAANIDLRHNSNSKKIKKSHKKINVSTKLSLDTSIISIIEQIKKIGIKEITLKF